MDKSQMESVIFLKKIRRKGKNVLPAEQNKLLFQKIRGRERFLKKGKSDIFLGE